MPYLNMLLLPLPCNMSGWHAAAGGSFGSWGPSWRRNSISASLHFIVRLPTSALMRGGAAEDRTIACVTMLSLGRISCNQTLSTIRNPDWTISTEEEEEEVAKNIPALLCGAGQTLWWSTVRVEDSWLIFVSLEKIKYLYLDSETYILTDIYTMFLHRASSATVHVPDRNHYMLCYWNLWECMFYTFNLLIRHFLLPRMRESNAARS